MGSQTVASSVIGGSPTKYQLDVSVKFRFQNCHLCNGKMSVRNSIDFSSETQQQIYFNKKLPI